MYIYIYIYIYYILYIFYTTFEYFIGTTKLQEEFYINLKKE